MKQVDIFLMQDCYQKHEYLIEIEIWTRRDFFCEDVRQFEFENNRLKTVHHSLIGGALKK